MIEVDVVEIQAGERRTDERSTVGIAAFDRRRESPADVVVGDSELLPLGRRMVKHTPFLPLHTVVWTVPWLLQRGRRRLLEHECTRIIGRCLGLSGDGLGHVFTVPPGPRVLAVWDAERLRGRFAV